MNVVHSYQYYRLIIIPSRGILRRLFWHLPTGRPVRPVIRRCHRQCLHQYIRTRQIRCSVRECHHGYLRTERRMRDGCGTNQHCTPQGGTRLHIDRTRPYFGERTLLVLACSFTPATMPRGIALQMAESTVQRS